MVILLLPPASVSLPRQDWKLAVASCLPQRAVFGMDARSFMGFVLCDQLGSRLPKKYKTGLLSISFSTGTRDSFLLLEVLFVFFPLYSVSQT